MAGKESRLSLSSRLGLTGQRPSLFLREQALGRPRNMVARQHERFKDRQSAGWAEMEAGWGNTGQPQAKKQKTDHDRW